MMYETIINILNAENIDTTGYTPEKIDALYAEVITMINAPFTEVQTHQDYINIFSNNFYTTRFYPLLLDEPVNITINGKEVTPRKITRDGRLYFSERLYGVLEVEYTTGLGPEDIEKYIIPIIVALIKQKNGGGPISSISEGDLSVSYSSSSTDTTSVDALIEKVKNKFKGRVRII